MRLIGYGVCGPKEKYLKATLDEFKRLCDETIIVGNKIDKASADLIKSYGFTLIRDKREWGKEQPNIKEDLVRKVEGLNPDWCLCLDMDEVLAPDITREQIESYFDRSRAFYVYVANLVDDGWSKQWSFWNVRLWKWDKDVKEAMGEKFYEFEARPLHCGLAPKWTYLHGSYAPFVLLHSGLKDTGDRARKVERYKTYDPNAKYRDGSYYRFLENAVAEHFDYEAVKDGVRAELDGISYKDRPVMATHSKAYCFFRRKKDGAVLDVPEKQYAEMKKNPNFEELYWVGKK